MCDAYEVLGIPDDADDDVSDEPKAIALHDQTGEPPGNSADDKPNDEINEHGPSVSLRPSSPAAAFPPK